MKKYAFLLVIVIPVLLVLLTNFEFEEYDLVDEVLGYAKYIAQRVDQLSLTGGYDFTDGFAEAALATVYIVSLPLRVCWSLIQLIYYTCRYWGVRIW